MIANAVRGPWLPGLSDAVRAEWTKLRTVRGWVIGMMAAAGAIVAFGVLPSMQGSCGRNGPGSECALPVGPDGELIQDAFAFVHRPLTGDGSITVRMTSLTGMVPGPPTTTGDPGMRTGLVPWAKAGLIIKASTTAGSPYAAVMLTGGHGVRMQYNYTHDVAGPPLRQPPWLRLSRHGDTITGYASADGLQWTMVGSTRLAGLSSTAQVGVFATSPQYAESVHQAGMSGDYGGMTDATATFEPPILADGWTGAGDSVAAGGRSAGGGSARESSDGSWTADQLGNGAGLDRIDGFTLTGSGDIAPAVTGATGIGTTVTQTLIGTFIGLILVVVIGAMFMTAEYRRGLIRTTLAATPRRGIVLATKAAVVGSVTFVAGLIGAAVVVGFGPGVLRNNGVYVFPVDLATDIRLMVGTGAMLAVAAILALSIGTLIRRGAAAVATVVAVIVVPYLLSMTLLPLHAAQWVLRISPAAAFAIQQSAIRYPQVNNVYSPNDGFFPLAPWAGFAVLCAWAALGLAAAYLLLQRRDA
jgi:ABC-2 family transporter